MPTFIRQQERPIYNNSAMPQPTHHPMVQEKGWKTSCVGMVTRNKCNSPVLLAKNELTESLLKLSGSMLFTLLRSIRKPYDFP